MERVVAKQLQQFMDKAECLDLFQFGFWHGCGTEAALVAWLDDHHRDLNMGSASLMVLLDLSAALDTINYGILLEGLSHSGVNGTVLKWMCSFLPTGPGRWC